MKTFAVPSIILFLLMLALSCQQNDRAMTYLAKVGEKVITPDDLKQRAELTIRPIYCDGKDPDDKGIILNTLIGEKLLALAAEADPQLAEDVSIQYYVQGVKEQMMRKLLLESELADQLEISSEEKLAALKQAAKKLQVIYLYSPSEEEMAQWRQQIKEAGSFEAVEKEVNRGKPPHVKQVIWGENLQAIETELFNDSVTVGAVVGPVKTKVGHYLFKVKDIRYEALLTQEQVNTKLQKVEKTLWERKWRFASATYVYEVMKNKDIQLDPRGFDLLLDYYKPSHAFPETKEEYLKLDQDELARLKQKARQDLSRNLQEPLLTIDGEPWTLGEFIDFTRRRPLIFRKKRIPENEFPHYLKLAIKELLADKYLTEIAYQKQFDKDPRAVQEEQRWRDHMLAVRKRNQLLKEAGFDKKITENYAEAINILRPQLNTLAKKYPVTINKMVFDDTPLTGVQWMALYNGMPYEHVVPAFPVITDDERLDYFTYFKQYATNEKN